MWNLLLQTYKLLESVLLGAQQREQLSSVTTAWPNRKSASWWNVCCLVGGSGGMLQNTLGLAPFRKR